MQPRQDSQDLQEPFIPKSKPIDITDTEFDAHATQLAGKALSYAYGKSAAALYYIGNFLGKNLKEIYPLALRPATQVITGFFTNDNGYFHRLNGQVFSDSLATVAAPFVIAAESVLPFGPNGFAMPFIPPFARAYQAGMLCINKHSTTVEELPDEKSSSLLEKISSNKKLIATAGTLIATYGIFLGLGIMIRLLGEQSSELDLINPMAVLKNLQEINPTWQNISLGCFTTLYTSTIGFILGKKAVSSASEWNQTKWNKVEHDFFLREQRKFESLANNPDELAIAHSAFIDSQRNKTNWKVIDVLSRYGLETLTELPSSLLKASRKTLEDLTRVKWFLLQADILKKYAIVKSSSLRDSIKDKKNSYITKLYSCFSWNRTPADVKQPLPSAPSALMSNSDDIILPVNDRKLSSDENLSESGKLLSYEDLSKKRKETFSKLETFPQRALGLFREDEKAIAKRKELDELRNQFNEDVKRFHSGEVLSLPLLTKDFNINVLAEPALQSVFQTNCRKMDFPLLSILTYECIEGISSEETYRKYQEFKYQIFVESVKQVFSLEREPITNRGSI